MGNKIILVVSFMTVIFASFYAGIFYNSIPTSSEITDEVILEVMDDLMENHYSQPTREELLEGALEGMISSLGDPYTSYFDQAESDLYQQSFGETYVGIGVGVKYIDNMIVIDSVKDDSPAQGAGMIVNDIIVEVDGVSIIETPYYETIGMILGEEGTDVSIGIIRNGVDGIINLTMTRIIIDSPTVIFDSFSRDDQLIGYIKVTTFGNDTVTLFINAIADLEILGIDALIIEKQIKG